MIRRALPLLPVALLLLAPAAAAEPAGRWFTDPDRALAAARDSKSPVLAVAMDHG